MNDACQPLDDPPTRWLNARFNGITIARLLEWRVSNCAQEKDSIKEKIKREDLAPFIDNIVSIFSIFLSLDRKRFKNESSPFSRWSEGYLGLFLGRVPVALGDKADTDGWDCRRRAQIKTLPNPIRDGNCVRSSGQQSHRGSGCRLHLWVARGESEFTPGARAYSLVSAYLPNSTISMTPIESRRIRCKGESVRPQASLVRWPTQFW